MPEIKRRVYLTETIEHAFDLMVPCDDEEAIADAAEEMFVQGHMPNHDESITSRTFSGSEVIDG